MANRRLSNTFLSISALSATTEDADFPKENCIDRTSPQRAWRSTTIASDQRLVIDCGSVQTSLTVYLDWVNFASMKYQESADGSTGWSDIGTMRTVLPDDMSGVYRRVDNITLTSKRYLGIYIPAQTPIDNTSYFRIGTFCIPINIVELNVETTVEYPFDISLPESHIIQNVFPTGRTEKIKLANLQPMFISFNLQTSAFQNIAGTTVKEISDLLRDSSQIIWIDFNLNQSFQSYLVRKSGELRSSLEMPNIGTVDFGTILLEVVI